MSPPAPPSADSGQKNQPPSLQSLAANILSHLPFSPLLPARSPSNPSHGPSSSGAMRSLSSGVRVDGVSGKGGGGGPAFVGQVFSMLDSSGNGLMSVTTHLDIPLISKRVPEWVKKVLARVTKNEKNGPVFQFFMDLNDAVSYVKRVNVPTGVVGACRLDVAYEHFKAKPHMFKFVPNKEQVKAANKLLRTLPKKAGRREVNGVPVFTADNLNIAIATADGIKWYAPYFFDKNLLDNILESSIDQHFHTLIHNRRMQRRRNIADDGFSAEVEENIDNLFEPPEVQQLMDEMGHPGVPLSVISKAAEVQLLDVVDKVLLGNKWLRKATGIQPKLPYLVDSFEERTAACFQKTCGTSGSDANQQIVQHCAGGRNSFSSDSNQTEGVRQNNVQSTSKTNHRFAFGDWFSNPWLKLQGNQQNTDTSRTTHLEDSETSQVRPNPLLPKITMVGFSMGEGSLVSKASLKKTMEELTKELELASQASAPNGEDKDPLFVANVGDYSTVTRVNLHKK